MVNFAFYPQFQNYNDMIEYLKKSGVLKTQKIIEAFSKYDRRDFLPDSVKELAYVDTALPIGDEVGQSSSQPYVTAFLIELLQPEKGNKILEVGFGSGWTTCILAELVGETGKIYALEIDEMIFYFGKSNIERYNFIEKGIVEIYLKDGSQGFQEKSPFDRILVSAFSPQIPQIFIDQLKENGILVIPDLEGIWQIKKNQNEIKKEYFEGFIFGPLRSEIKHKNA